VGGGGGRDVSMANLLLIRLSSSDYGYKLSCIFNPVT
jgi:hypothetical protein